MLHPKRRSIKSNQQRNSMVISDNIILDDYMKSKDNLLDMLTTYVKEHPEVDINIIIPQEENITKILEQIS